MAILRCPMCGAMVRAEEGKFTAQCEYCGVEMTLFESTAEFEVDSRGVLVQYNGRGGDVVIPEGVRIIGEECFAKNERIFTVKLPESVVEIRHRAFNLCAELEEINIPVAVETIGHHVFSECGSLREIVLPDGLLSLKTSLFYKCGSLRKVTIGTGLRTMEDYVFGDCEKLEQITLPNTVKRMGEEVFENCFALRSVNIPDRLECIPCGSFKNCRSLTEITIPDSVESIGSNAFEKCSSLHTIRIPDSVHTIGKFAFQHCTCLRSVHLPDSVRFIMAFTFAGCTSLTDLKLGNGVEMIESHAFSGCDSISGELMFPETLTTLDVTAFYNTKYPDINAVVFNGPRVVDIAIACPNVKRVSFGGKVEVINRFATYASRESVESIEIGPSVKEIGASVFGDCKKLKTVEIPGSVKRIGKSAFDGCRGLTRVVIGEGCEELGERAFNFNTKEGSIKRHVYLPESLKRMDHEAIYDWDWDDNCYYNLTIHTPKTPLLSAIDQRFQFVYIQTAAERERARQNRIRQLTNELGTARRELAQANQLVVSLQQEKQALEGKLREETNRLATLTGMFKGSQRKKCQEDIDQLRGQLSSNASKLAAAVKKQQSVNVRAYTLDQELKKLQ